MNKSIVTISMSDENELGCSYAIVDKGIATVVIIFRKSECAIYNYNVFRSGSLNNYLLLKHYVDETSAYKDFLKLIGKMCKKAQSSKYFLNPIEEDNRMVCSVDGTEHMINDYEIITYKIRFDDFINHIHCISELI